MAIGCVRRSDGAATEKDSSKLEYSVQIHFFVSFVATHHFKIDQALFSDLPQKMRLFVFLEASSQRIEERLNIMKNVKKIWMLQRSSLYESRLKNMALRIHDIAREQETVSLGLIQSSRQRNPDQRDQLFDRGDELHQEREDLEAMRRLRLFTDQDEDEPAQRNRSRRRIMPTPAEEEIYQHEWYKVNYMLHMISVFTHNFKKASSHLSSRYHVTAFELFLGHQAGFQIDPQIIRKVARVVCSQSMVYSYMSR